MPLLQNLYPLLHAEPDAAVDQALVEALPTAQPAEVKTLVAMLLDRGHRPGLLGLIQHFHCLPAAVQPHVTLHLDRFEGLLRQVPRWVEKQAINNVLQMIRQSQTPRYSYLLTQLLLHGPPALRSATAQVLLELTHLLDDPSNRSAADPAAVHHLCSAVEEAVAAYGAHQRPEVLQALLELLPRPLSEWRRTLTDHRHPLAPALRQLLEKPATPAVRRALLSLLTLPTLAESTRIGLQHCNTAATLGDALASWHLLPVPAVAHALQRLEDPDALVPPADDLRTFTHPAARGLGAWIAALPLEPARRMECLARCALLPDAPARLAALRHLLICSASRQSPSGEEVISAFCFDADPAIARIALRHLLARNWEGLARLLSKLLNSAHADIRQIAAQHLGPMGFVRLWGAWPRLRDDQRLAAGKALIKVDPNFARQLAEKLAPAGPKTRLRALALIADLNQGHLFEPALAALLADPDVVVASAAVRALGSAGSTTAVATLEQCLTHRDSRIRANAVEALAHLRVTRHVEQLLQMAQTDDNRPRANAIKALMGRRTQDALAALTHMLADQRPRQRISALWLVEVLGLFDVGRQVAEMSLGDPDQQVRQRADRVIHQLIDAYPAAPAEPAPAQEKVPA